MTQLYQRICGEGGCSPEYFFRHMTMQEAEDYIAGQDRRYRQQWEMTRLLAKLIHKVETGKELKLEFPWDNEEEEERPEATPEELAKLNEDAKRMAEYLNRTKR